jgi:hypothetical protein
MVQVEASVVVLRSANPGEAIANVRTKFRSGASLSPMLHNFMVQDRYAASIAAFIASYSMFLNLT